MKNKPYILLLCGLVLLAVVGNISILVRCSLPTACVR